MSEEGSSSYERAGQTVGGGREEGGEVGLCVFEHHRMHCTQIKTHNGGTLVLGNIGQEGVVDMQQLSPNKSFNLVHTVQLAHCEMNSTKQSEFIVVQSDDVSHPSSM